MAKGLPRRVGRRVVAYGGRARAGGAPRSRRPRKSKAERPCCQHVRHTDIDESDPPVDDFQERCPDWFVATDSFPFPSNCDLYWSGYGWKKRKPGNETR